jgi:hypothetical protein
LPWAFEFGPFGAGHFNAIQFQTIPRHGKSAWGFGTPSMLSVLVEKFKIAPITTPDADLAAILG